MAEPNADADVLRALRRSSRANAKLLQQQRVLESELVELQLRVLQAEGGDAPPPPPPPPAAAPSDHKKHAQELAAAAAARDEALVERDLAAAELARERRRHAEAVDRLRLEAEAAAIAAAAEREQRDGAARDALLGLSAAHADERCRRLLAERELRDWKRRAAEVAKLAKRRVARAARRAKATGDAAASPVADDALRSAFADGDALGDASSLGSDAFPEFPFDDAGLPRG
jgi:hypothetical protein